MKGGNLPDNHHVIRVVPYSKLDKDEEGQPTGGLLFSAFQRRESEDGLSVTWLEYFAGHDHGKKVERAVHGIRASNYKPGGKAAFAIGMVGKIKELCRAQKHKVRIIHAPVDDNKAHAEVRQIPRDDHVLLDALATADWMTIVFNSKVDAGSSPAPDAPAEQS
ncbi:MAG: hypothetical protein KJ587_08380 [Alphaproteobacteria bacterium]|nr:hypothetical protein [Alphaproteobacteria bacterium]